MPTITEDWADGSYSFRLTYAQWAELDRVLQIGPKELAVKLIEGRHRFNWVREVIRCGLIGGGMPFGDALRLVRIYCEERGILDNDGLAIRIIQAGLFSPSVEEEEQEDPGEAMATEKNAMSESTSSPQSETQPSSV